MSKTWKKVEAADYARLSINPMRRLNFETVVKPNASKESIRLHIGPTISGDIAPPKQCIEALTRSSGIDNFFYNAGRGRLEAREAVAQYSQHQGDVNADDVILACGCSHAVEMCILSLVGPGENLLIPRPCFNYWTLTDGLQIETRSYNLDPTNDWNVDLKHMDRLVDGKTRAILVNNPGNPCGTVFSNNSKQHLMDILEIAERHQIPIISDEVYELFTFPGVKFYSIASLSHNVPVLTCSGLSKRFFMPGIRLGWIILHDRHGALENIKQGLFNVTGRIFGPSSTVQFALPEMLADTPQEFFDETMEKIARRAKLVYDILKKSPGLEPFKPKGAMYLMVGIKLQHFPDFPTCGKFTDGLMREQSVMLFPSGRCFNYPGYMRIVLTLPDDKIIEAGERIKDFCETHFMQI